jgi:hypothetical protein
MSEIADQYSQEHANTGTENHRIPLATAKLLKVLLVFCVIVTAVAIWSDVSQLRLLVSARQGNPPTDSEAEAHDQRHALIGIVQASLNVPMWIVFLVWTYRANASLRRLGTEGMEFTPGWSVGWYFVPIVNLWKPCQAMCEIWTASEHPSDRWRSESASALVGLWWAFWLLSTVSGRIAARLSLRAETIDAMATSSYVMLISDAMDIAFFILSFTLVADIMAMQARRATADSGLSLIRVDGGLEPDIGD